MQATRTYAIVGIAPDQIGAVGRVDGGECPIDGWRQIIWPSDVDRTKARVDVYFESADATVQGCSTFPTAQRPAWNKFIASWRAVRERPTAFTGARTELNNVCQMSSDLDGWYKVIREHCKLQGPEPPVPPPPTPSPVGEVTSLVKWVAIGGAVIGGAVLLIAYTPEIKAALGVLRR